MPDPSPIVIVAKKVCPAVITVVVSKDLPRIDGFYFLPSGSPDSVIPKMGKKIKEKTQIGGGSGFIVSKDGYVLTSNHVVADPAAEYTILLDPAKKYAAKVLSRDSVHDIAVLKIDQNNLPFLELGESEKIEIGEQVIAVGNPLGEFHDTVSAGIISGLSRFITAQSGMNGDTSNLKG